MTTAHRPTWYAAQAGDSDIGNWSTGGQVSKQISSKELPGQTKLKLRQPGQNSEADLRKRDVRAFLEESESRAVEGKEAGREGKYAEAAAAREERGQTLLLTVQGEVDAEVVKKYDDADDADSGSDLDSSDDSDDSDDGEDEEALQKELAKIRKERDEARKKKEQEEAELEAKKKTEAALTGNHLINPSASSQVKRRWNDDVVFKGQAKTEPEAKKHFVNDTVRNDFHRRFLTKYIK